MKETKVVGLGKKIRVGSINTLEKRVMKVERLRECNAKKEGYTKCSVTKRGESQAEEFYFNLREKKNKENVKGKRESKDKSEREGIRIGMSKRTDRKNTQPHP